MARSLFFEGGRRRDADFGVELCDLGCGQRLIQNLIAITALDFPIRGVRNWNCEWRDLRRAELAEKILAPGHRAFDAIAIIRAPFAHAGEGASRRRGEGETPEIAGALDVAFTPIERLRAAEEVFDEIKALRYSQAAAFSLRDGEPLLEFLTVTPKLPVPQFRRYATSQATDCGCAHDDDAAVDLECETVEALLGTAYQVKITAVVEAAVRLLGNPDHEIRGMSPRFNAKFSQVEVLWALGNYFKHRDEWDRSEWDTPTASRRFTIRALIAAGLEPSSSGNLREGATALGNAAFSEMAVFERIIDEWAAAIRTEVRC